MIDVTLRACKEGTSVLLQLNLLAHYERFGLCLEQHDNLSHDNDKYYMTLSILYLELACLK